MRKLKAGPVWSVGGGERVVEKPKFRGVYNLELYIYADGVCGWGPPQRKRGSRDSAVQISSSREGPAQRRYIPLSALGNVEVLIYRPHHRRGPKCFIYASDRPTTPSIITARARLSSASAAWSIEANQTRSSFAARTLHTRLWCSTHNLSHLCNIILLFFAVVVFSSCLSLSRSCINAHPRVYRACNFLLMRGGRLVFCI